MSALVQIGASSAPHRVATQVRSLRAGEKFMLALVGLGCAGLLFAALAPGSWAAKGAMGVFWFALIVLGGSWYFWMAYGRSHPGIKNDGIFHSATTHRGALAWIIGVALTAFYVALYWHGDSLSPVYSLLDPLALALTGASADEWFLYGALYTAAVGVFGVRMAMKYRHSRYQLIRTGSVFFFQLGFAFLLPGMLKKINQPDFYFTYFWPLKPDYLLPFDYVMGESGILAAQYSGTSVGRFMILWAALMLLVATPLLTWFFGKRWYCSWVCGCGGLAETMGDPFRQLSDKSEKAWKIERWSIHLVLVSIVAITALLWFNEWSGRALLGDDGSGLFWKSYGLVIVMAFSGVLGVGFYPLLGSRFWCRFGCPMAAILGFLQRFFSRFRITTNGGQCISCGNCSTYCEMGIDVRSYAQRGENIVRSSCVGCGVCAEVCPRGVLRLENGPVANRFDGADKPLHEAMRALGLAARD